jgi:hypothetical protein
MGPRNWLSATAVALAAMAVMAGTGVASTAATAPMKKVPANMVFLELGANKTTGSCLWTIGVEFGTTAGAKSYLVTYWDGYYHRVTTVTLTPAQFQDKTLGKGQLPAGMHYVAATGGSYSPPTNCHRMNFSDEKKRFNQGAKAWGVLTK